MILRSFIGNFSCVPQGSILDPHLLFISYWLMLMICKSITIPNPLPYLKQLLISAHLFQLLSNKIMVQSIETSSILYPFNGLIVTVVILGSFGQTCHSHVGTMAEC